MGLLLGNFNFNKNLERIILEMKVGEEGWIEPQSLEIDYDFEGYLDLEGSVVTKMDTLENYTVYIKRIGPEKDNFLVDISNAKKYSWKRLSKEMIEDLFEDGYGEMIVKLNYQKEISSVEEFLLNKEIDKALLNEEYEKLEKLEKERLRKFKKY
ncbi:hypothetical protein J4412_02435 [Candidatus Pacearchaeota archaeon]|nr:hypothetical protein [Candidatus Pacearchaeota archaeon]